MCQQTWHISETRPALNFEFKICKDLHKWSSFQQASVALANEVTMKDVFLLYFYMGKI